MQKEYGDHRYGILLQSGAGGKLYAAGSPGGSETGEKLLIHGKEVTASLTFTAEESSGEEEMTFLLDASGLAEKSVVVYETLLHKNIPVTEHADPKMRRRQSSLKSCRKSRPTIRKQAIRQCLVPCLWG